MSLERIVGQEQAKRVMSRAAWNIRENPTEIADSFCFIGPPSSGKTLCARAMAEEAGIPLLELQPQAIRTDVALMNAIQKFVDETFGGALVKNEIAYPARFALLIDEVHQVTPSIEQALLKATEPSDRLLVDERGRQLDTRSIVFMFATTDRGDLFDALDTRTVKIPLRLYSRSEVAAIVRLVHPRWPVEACELIAKYNPCIPREALAFARDMEIEARRSGERDAVKIAREIAIDHRIDSHGMTEQRLAILTALGTAPISRARMRHVAQVKDAELQKFILPPLLAVLPDSPNGQPLVTVSNRGYTITPAGLAELDKRKVPNNGIRAIPDNVRPLFQIDVVPAQAGNPVTEGFRRLA